MKHEKEPKKQEVLTLGAFRYDRASRVLSDAEGGIVRMRRQSEEVLSVLAEDAGEVVSKAKLIEAVWPGLATTDDSLVQCIADIRRTIGREVVQTFSKKGYRLCPTPPRPARRQVAGWFWPALATCGLAILTALSVLSPPWSVVGTSEPFIPPVVHPDRTLAVLPFSPDADVACVERTCGMRFWRDRSAGVAGRTARRSRSCVRRRMGGAASPR